MTMFQILAVLAVGIIMLIFSLVIKKKWLRYISLIPILVAVVQLAYLFLFMR